MLARQHPSVHWPQSRWKTAIGEFRRVAAASIQQVRPVSGRLPKPGHGRLTARTCHIATAGTLALVRGLTSEFLLVVRAMGSV